MQSIRIYILCIGILAIGSCRRNADPEPIISELKVHCKVWHHTYGVPNATVYIKKGTTVWPGNQASFYDGSLVTDGNGEISFTGLSGGKYVFWAAGYDAVVTDSVSGYMVVNSTLDPGEKKELELYIPVSE